MISIKDIAWLAGLLEGEGYFHHSISAPHIDVGMTDLDIIGKVKNLVGQGCSKIYDKRLTSGNKRVYTINIRGRKAAEWMMTIYPLMGNRRKEKIRSVLEIWKDKTYLSDSSKFRCGHLKADSNIYIDSRFRKLCKTCRRIAYSKYNRKCNRTVIQEVKKLDHPME